MSLLSYVGNLEDRVVSRVKKFVAKYNPSKIYVLFSAGKDSVAALWAAAVVPEARQRLIVVYNELIGNTHPINVESAYRIIDELLPEANKRIVTRREQLYSVSMAAFISKKPVFIHVRASDRYGTGFWDSVMRWDVPVKLKNGARWCYNEYKEKWWRKLFASRRERYMVVGIKRSDSWQRSRVWSNAVDCVIEAIRSGIHDYMLSPICDLTDKEVWELLSMNGLDKHLQSYTIYGDSMNCSFCPFRPIEKQVRIIDALASDEWGRRLLHRVRDILRELARSRKDSVAASVRDKWLEAIESVLGDD